MFRRLDIVRKVIGDYRMNRLLEIINILGKSLPEEIDIYTYVSQSSYPKYNEWVIDYSDDLKSGRIYLQGDPNNREQNNIEFSSNFVSLRCTDNTYRYYWCSIFNDEEKDDLYGAETFDIDYGRIITTEFGLNKEATCTSLLYLYNHAWGSPKFISDISSIRVLKKGSRALPIQKYFDVFKAYMKSEEKNRDCVLANAPVDTILKVFEGPILYLVDSLMHEDQSWRFDYERAKILSDYEKGIRKSYEDHAKELNDAATHLSNSLHSCEVIKKSEIKILERLRKKCCNPNTTSDNNS